MLLSRQLNVSNYTCRLRLAFPQVEVAETIQLFGLIFWSTDMIMSFVTGYVKDGSTELHLTAAAMHYLRGRFFLDFVIILCDWAGFVASFFADGADASRNVRILRVIKTQRLLRMFRAGRMMHLINGLFDQLEVRAGNMSSVLVIFCRALFIFVVFTWVNHILACLWAVIGFHAPSDTGARWVDLPVYSGGGIFKSWDTAYQYWTSLHWSMSQASVPGLLAVNSWERAACVWLRIVDKMFNCTIISALSATMVGVTILANKQGAELRKLSLFLRDHGVSPSIAVRVRNEVIKRSARTVFPLEEDVPFLKSLPTSLRRELRFDMFCKGILSHPIFRTWYSVSTSIILDVCNGAVIEMRLAADDGLFECGAEAEGAYVVMRSQLQYVQNPETSVVTDWHEHTVLESAWLSEASLWTHWLHVGSAVALTDCVVLLVQTGPFIEAVHRHRIIREMASAFASVFHDLLVNMLCVQDTLSDVALPGASFTDVIQLLPQDIKTVMARAAIANQLGQSRRATAHSRALEALMTDVTHGRSLVFLNGRGELRRIVNVTATRIHQSHEQDEGR